MEKGVLVLAVLIVLFFTYTGSAQLDCLGCHQNDTGLYPPIIYPAINVSLFGFHRNVNTTDGIGNISNSDCIECHYDISMMFAQGFTVSTHTCEDCHLQGNLQSTAPKVFNHTINSNIRVNASCFDCHNKTANLFKYNANASAAHYGRNASFGIPIGAQYCAYCHQNSSTIYKDVMQNPNNSMLGNHTTGIINPSHLAKPSAGELDCIACHGLDILHGANITKPVPNSSFCKNCHDKDITLKNMHAGRVECIRCHTQVPSNIHNIKYILQNGSYQSIQATSCADCHNFSLPLPSFVLPFPAAGCTTCHQGQGLVNFNTAHLIPTPMNHSVNPSSGALWNGTRPAYWDNTSQQSACNYCHSKSAYHNLSGLGNITMVKGNNSVNQSLNNSRWCANCHYAGAPEYAGTAFYPEPPEILNTSGKVPAISGSGVNFENHSGFVSSGYNDSVCKVCHNNNLDAGATSLNFSHNIGITSCLACHQQDMGVYPAINISLFGFHRNINTTDGVGNLSNSDCVECHYNVSMMFAPGFTVSTHTCEDCHLQGNLLSTAPKVFNHTNYSNIRVNASCFGCHSKTINLSKYNVNASAAHYGINVSFGIPVGAQYCAYCHQNSSTIYKDVMQNSNNSMLGNHTTGIINPSHLADKPNCTACHGQDILHGANITKPVLNSSFCKNCHDKDITLKNMHAGKVECIRCHTQIPSDIHNIKYILQNGSYRSIQAASCADCHDLSLQPPPFILPFTAADCTACHQGQGLGNFSTAPLIPTPMAHSDNPFNGSLWNATGYWSNTSQPSMCLYCHTNTSLHSDSGLGNVSNIQSGNQKNQSITDTGHWCANCHYGNSSYSGANYSYNGTAYEPVPPNINISQSKKAGDDATDWYNHTGFSNYSDAKCIECHGSRITKAYSAEFMHNVSKGGGGPNCIGCHDIAGSGAPEDKRIDAEAVKQGVHMDLNSEAINSSALDPVNKACWACHGNGEQPVGHPPEYKSPRKCGSDECHSLNQSYRAPMVYSHFRNASLNDNPEDVLNYNVTTNSGCEECHANSVTAIDKNQNSTASHYASLELLDSINCIYCHLNKDNSEEWGNATLIYKNMTSLIELDREKNKFTVKEGDFADLSPRFRLKVLGISTVRESAFIELFEDGVSVDRSLVNIGEYTYDEELTIDNATETVSSIELNITGIFKANNDSFIQFEGFRLKRMHSENTSTSCYQCHVYMKTRTKYKVIERVSKDIDEIFYTQEFVNLTDKKEYDENTALLTLANLTDSDRHVNTGAGRRKALFEGETWKISEDYSLLVKAVAVQSDEALLSLHAKNYSFENFVKKGDVFEYSPAINYTGYRSNNITIFRANISEIIQANPNMVVLEDVLALSPEIKKINANETINGYNASWLWENSTWMTGKIPNDFHSPQLYSGKDGGGDCLSCHGGFVEKKVLSLGRHNSLNGGGNYACYACHGGREGIKTHPYGYRDPRNCLSCHASIVNNYSAVYIGDEEHKNGICEDCHVSNTHDITGFNTLPYVRNISLLRQDNSEGLCDRGV